MTRIEVPHPVITAIRARWPQYADGWQEAVLTESGVLLEKYRATPVEVLSGRYAYVVAAHTIGGRRLVFRASPDPTGQDQANVAAALAGLGVSPKVYEVQVTDTGCWTVMDRVEPGTSLGNLGASLAPAADLATVLRPLLAEPAPSPSLPYIGDWLRERLEDDDLTDVAPGRDIASGDERNAALAVLADLTSDGERGLCHGDTSPGNILKGDGGLYLIDPRGMSGEVTYDVAVLGLKAALHVPRLRRIRKLAAAVGVDIDRAELWAQVALAARV